MSSIGHEGPPSQQDIYVTPDLLHTVRIPPDILQRTARTLCLDILQLYATTPKLCMSSMRHEGLNYRNRHVL